MRMSVIKPHNTDKIIYCNSFLLSTLWSIWEIRPTAVSWKMSSDSFLSSRWENMFQHKLFHWADGKFVHEKTKTGKERVNTQANESLKRNRCRSNQKAGGVQLVCSDWLVYTYFRAFEMHLRYFNMSSYAVSNHLPLLFNWHLEGV